MKKIHYRGSTAYTKRQEGESADLERGSLRLSSLRSGKEKELRKMGRDQKNLWAPPNRPPCARGGPEKRQAERIFEEILAQTSPEPDGRYESMCTKANHQKTKRES